MLYLLLGIVVDCNTSDCQRVGRDIITNHFFKLFTDTGTKLYIQCIYIERKYSGLASL